MIIKVNSNKRYYFRQLLEFLSLLPKYNTLVGQEKEVLAEMLYYFYFYADKSITLNDGEILKRHKPDIREKLHISKASLDNVLHKLRVKGFLKGKDIAPEFLLPMDEKLTIIFNIKSDGDR